MMIIQIIMTKIVAQMKLMKLRVSPIVIVMIILLCIAVTTIITGLPPLISIIEMTNHNIDANDNGCCGYFY